MFDSHVHYDHKRFDNGREDLLKKMHEEGLHYCLNAAIDFESNIQMKKLLEKYPWIYFAAGIHPNAVELSEENDSEYIRRLQEWLKEERVKAIGETGLDYFRLEQMKEQCAEGEIEQRKVRQKEWFRISLQLAKEAEKPLVLHIRGEADEDALQILEECQYEGMTGVVHCFSGTASSAKAYLDRGFYLGIGGMITREDMEGVREAVKEARIEKILLETDSPFVRPAGMEGKRNTSESLPVIVRRIAEIKGMGEEDVENITEENAKRLFQIG